MKSIYIGIAILLSSWNIYAENFADLFWHAHIAYKRHQYSTCSQMYESLVKKGSKDPDVLYNAAGCFALDGKKDLAFDYINKMCSSDFIDVQGFLLEDDFKVLHQDARWQSAVGKCQAAEQNHVTHCNPQVYGLYLAMLRSPDHWLPSSRDKLIPLISAKQLHSAFDHFHAA